MTNRIEMMKKAQAKAETKAQAKVRAKKAWDLEREECKIKCGRYRQCLVKDGERRPCGRLDGDEKILEFSIPELTIKQEDERIASLSEHFSWDSTPLLFLKGDELRREVLKSVAKEQLSTKTRYILKEREITAIQTQSN